jgi:site-specific recombinase XerD
MSRGKKRGAPEFWIAARKYLHIELPEVARASPKTLQSYRLSLECYLRYLGAKHGAAGADVTFDCFDIGHIKGFKAWMMDEEGYAPKTCSLRLSAIRSFLSYAAQEDITLVALSEAAKAVKGPRAPRQPIEYLSREATAALLSGPSPATAKGRRNRMLLVMMYDTGARVSELVGIKASDLHLPPPSHVLLVGKGNKPRIVPLMSKTVEHLGAYMREFHPGWPEASVAPLFYSNCRGRPRPLSTDTVSVVLKSAAIAAHSDCPELDGNIRCHTIRKTRAMDLYMEGIELPIIMRLLGHESMATTTTFYAFATMDMVREAIEKADSLSDMEPKRWKESSSSEAIYSLK